MSSELTFPIRPASEAPTRSKPSFQVRRRSAAELPPHMVGETLLRAYRTPLLQFIADWNRSPAKADMIEKGLVYLSGEGVCDTLGVCFVWCGFRCFVSLPSVLLSSIVV